MGMSSVNICESSNFRCDSSCHGRYSNAFLIEQPLSHIKRWDILLDEVLRLLCQTAYLTVSYHNIGPHASNALIKKFLGRRYQYSISQAEEWHDKKSGRYISTFHVSKLFPDRYRADSWSFCILTNGNKEDIVKSFCESVRSQKDGNKHQILIFSSKAGIGLEYNAEYINIDGLVDSWGEISKKKNELAKRASGENLVLAHDRYTLSANFVESFDKYGYDFDYLTIPQYYESGAIYPSLNGIESPPLMWKKVYFTSEYSKYPPNPFVNGGFIIVKRDTIRDIRFNELNNWNQAEDVELGLAMNNVSLPPRVNTLTKAITHGITEEYTKYIFDINLKKTRRSIKLILRMLIQLIAMIVEALNFFIRVQIFIKNDIQRKIDQ